MASDREDFVYFVGRGEEPGGPSLGTSASALDGGLLTDDDASANSPSAAVNEETGEINWDCPCLKSALEPPCGDAFRTAFSCFVASKTEPKGMDCHELFKAMQDCFVAHPEKYGSILEDEEGSGGDGDDENGDASSASSADRAASV